MDRLTSTEGSLALAVSALLLVVGYRFTRPSRGREWGTIVAYATALVLGLLGAQGLLPGTSPASPPAALRIPGAVLIGAGLLLAGAASRAHSGAAPGVLVTTGPYARIRHPLYAGLAIALLGHLLRGPSRPGALAFIASLAAYATVAAAEDADARRAFGDAWARYSAVTRAVFPILRRP